MSKVDDLLKPRYKVIARVPVLEFQVGEIFIGEWLEFNSIKYYYDRYPVIFKPLSWWEDRKPEEMPEFVKLCFDNKTHYVHKVESWKGDNYRGQPLYEYYNKVNYLSIACVSELLPATKTEYDSYINKKP